MVNPVGLAYAEESPLLVISGAPETRFRSDKPLLHHCVKNFNTQHDVYSHVTPIYDDSGQCPHCPAWHIDEVFDTTLTCSRPGYIELCRDMVNTEIEIKDKSTTQKAVSGETLKAAIDDMLGRLRSSKQPVLLVGAQVRRFGLKDDVVALATALNIPVVTSILGKATFPETHANFIGNYFGQFGSPAVKEYVEGADCILALGAVMTEMETGGYTAQLGGDKLIQVTAHDVQIGDRVYKGLTLQAVVAELLQINTSKLAPPVPFSMPKVTAEEISEDPSVKHLTVKAMIEKLNKLLSGKRGDGFSVVTDTGDCMYAGMSLKTDIFLAPGYYVSMGFGMPAAIGAQLAMPERRPIVLVGDGAFQMTGMDLSTAVKHKLNPIVIVFNNASYACCASLTRA